MTKSTLTAQALILAALASASSFAAEIHVPLSEYNMSGGFVPGFPTGIWTALTGTTYDIPTSGPNIWNAVNDTGGSRVMDVPVGIFGVSEVHAIINSWWGEQLPGSFAQVEFFGSDGGYFQMNLDGNSEVRDYFYNIYANNISGTTTQLAYLVSVGPGGFGNEFRLDETTFDLPPTFDDETLVNIVFTDTGIDEVQRIFVGGLTVEAVPEPSTIAGASALAALLAGRVLRRKAK